MAARSRMNPLRGSLFAMGKALKPPPVARVMFASLGYHGLFGLTHWPNPNTPV